MPFNLVYGKQLDSHYLDAGAAIALDVTEGKFLGVSEKINNAFFGGGALTPKSFTQLTSLEIPDVPAVRDNFPEEQRYITIKSQISFSAVMGYVESIPLIGSAIAIINSHFQLFAMLSSYTTLKRNVTILNDTLRNSPTNPSDMTYKTSLVVAASIDYTVHQNHLIGSLLSIIPLVKPMMRVAQGILFHTKVSNLLGFSSMN